MAGAQDTLLAGPWDADTVSALAHFCKGETEERVMRTGTDYLAALKDDREIYIDGQRVHDVASHPAFAPIAATVAELFDLAADPTNAMTYTAPETGEEANLVYSIPRSQADLTSRRRAIKTWARHTHGWVGRSPDHIGSFLAGFAAHPEAFAAEPHDLAANVVSYYRRLLRESLFVSSALIPPQVSRATTAHGWDGEFIQAGVAAERPDGLVIRGALMLATGAAVADEIFVSCIKPLTPEDRDFAVSFTVPVAAAGLKLYCRRPYAPAASSRYDYPLSTRYDETDALVVFGDVLVPWERVFVHGDVALLNGTASVTHSSAHTAHQGCAKNLAKCELVLGVALLMTQTLGTAHLPHSEERIGELVMYTELTRACMRAAEADAALDEFGVMCPAPMPAEVTRNLFMTAYPRMAEILQLLGSSSLMALPTEADMTGPLAGHIDQYLATDGSSARDRVKLFHLAWDIACSSFGNRQVLYERFFASDPLTRAKALASMYPKKEAIDRVLDFLGRD
jgi:4-hydroxyphenylacetate 3-monooxygenase